MSELILAEVLQIRRWRREEGILSIVVWERKESLWVWVLPFSFPTPFIFGVCVSLGSKGKREIPGGPDKLRARLG